ncbi:MAG: hypothetical protein ACYC0M_03255 [Burkholderiales bacterium]
MAEQIARIALGQSLHVQRILAGANQVTPSTSASASTSAIAMLTVANGEDPWHRDGWIFQAMSWIAANKAAPGGLIRSPQMILADKGFDGLQLELDTNTGIVSAAIIFEDKATDNPRTTIHNKVWPEFKKMEDGVSDNVLTSEVVAILQTHPTIDPYLAIQNIIWNEARHYRISITVGDTHSDDEGRTCLFKDYDTTVSGNIQRRRGETFHINNLRQWMNSLAQRAIAAIHTQAAANV